MKTSDEAALARVKTMTRGPELLEALLKAPESAPSQLRVWSPARMFQFVRCRLKFTQAELARKAGLTQSQVSRVESGADCLLSTWTRAYEAMGFELRLLPTTDLSSRKLEKRAERGRPEDHWLRQRARPRRLWVDGRMSIRGRGPGAAVPAGTPPAAPPTP